MTRTLPRFVPLLIVACAPSADDSPPPPLTWEAQVLLDGEWVAAGQVVRQDGRTWVRYELSDAGVVGGLALSATVETPEAGTRGWLSNGFQSWSQSGVVQAPAAVDPIVREAALQEVGDVEVLREGRTHSWWHTFVDLGDSSLVAGALTAHRFKSWAAVEGQGELRIRLVSGGAGEALPAGAGDVVEGERWFIERTRDLPAALQRYGAALPSRRWATEPARRPEPEMGWNSWYDLWDDVTEEDIRANAPLASAEFSAAGVDGPVRVVVDDGWQVAWGDWRPNDKFPSGMDGLAGDLRGEGHAVGLWLAPLLVDAELPSPALRPCSCPTVIPTPARAPTSPPRPWPPLAAEVVDAERERPAGLQQQSGSAAAILII